MRIPIISQEIEDLKEIYEKFENGRMANFTREYAQDVRNNPAKHTQTALWTFAYTSAIFLTIIAINDIIRVCEITPNAGQPYQTTYYQLAKAHPEHITVINTTELALSEKLVQHQLAMVPTETYKIEAIRCTYNPIKAYKLMQK